MMDSSQMAIWAILVPTTVAVLSHLIAKLPRVGARLAKAVCIWASYITLFCVFLLFLAVASGPMKIQLFLIALQITTINMGLYVDYLALIPALLCSLFGALALTYNVYYLSPQNKAYKVSWDFNRSYSFILLFMGAMIGTLFSSDLIGLLIFWELVSICSYALISFWNEDPFCLWAALKCFIMTHIGSIALLIVAIVLFLSVGTLEILELGQKIPLGEPIIFIVMPLLLIAALPKTVQFPFHTWLPDGTVAPTSATVLFHVCGFQTGIYAIIRFFFQVFHSHVVYASLVPFSSLFGNISIWSFLISMIGAITLLVAALNGIIENDFKRVVAYSTISELGYIVMVIGLTTPLGVTAGLFHLMSHAFIAALLFLCAGAVIYTTGKYNLNELGGLHRRMPVTTTCCTISVLAIGALPMLSEFASKYMIIHSTLDANSPFFLIITLLGAVLHIAIATRLLHSVFLTKSELNSSPETSDPPISMLIPMIVMSSAIIMLGIIPQSPLEFLIVPSIQQLGYPFSVTEPPGIIITPIGFWNPIIVAVFALGLFLFLIFMVNYLARERIVYRRAVTKEGIVYKRVTSEEAIKPFLCGEDAQLLDGARAYHFYHALISVLRIDRVCHASDIDRFYNALSRGFSNLCAKLLRLDIQQRYFPAVLSFIIGAVVIVFIAISAG